jgi:IS1 family transposase
VPWQANTPAPCTTNSWLFPPKTRELQCDEKWAFVAKKEAQCDPDDPADAQQGDNWDHVALDAEHRLVLSVVPGKRTAEKVEHLVQDAKKRLGERTPNLITTDEYPAYKTAILNAYGETVTPPPTGKPGRPQAPYKVPPPDLKYAVVHKTREKGRVVKIDYRVVFGTVLGVQAALEISRVSQAINTAFVERQNGTDRNRNARKVRKTYCFSKDWNIHEAVTFFTMYSYNFCWPVRTLRERDAEGRWQEKTPAMAAGLADHVWPLEEWLRLPVVQRE